MVPLPSASTSLIMSCSECNQCEKWAGGRWHFMKKAAASQRPQGGWLLPSSGRCRDLSRACRVESCALLWVKWEA